jgi:hypothetical protein
VLTLLTAAKQWMAHRQLLAMTRNNRNPISEREAKVAQSAHELNIFRAFNTHIPWRCEREATAHRKRLVPRVLKWGAAQTGLPRLRASICQHPINPSDPDEPLLRSTATAASPRRRRRHRPRRRGQPRSYRPRSIATRKPRGIAPQQEATTPTCRGGTTSRIRSNLRFPRRRRRCRSVQSSSFRTL